MLIAKDAADSSPITKEMMDQALDESHHSCNEGCIHMAAAEGCHAKAEALVREQATMYFAKGLDPIFGAYFFGLHVGYRLGQLMSAPVDQDKVN